MNNERLQSQPRDVHMWYETTYGELHQLASQDLSLVDADKVLLNLAKRLPSCSAKTQPDFELWAREFVSRAVELMALLRDLYLEHQPLVYAAIAKGLGPVYRNDQDFCRTVDPETGALMTANETAQELAAETWTKVLMKLGKWRPGRAKITTWIYKIAYQTARNHMRLRMRRSKKESYLTVDDLAAKETRSLTYSEQAE